MPKIIRVTQESLMTDFRVGDTILRAKQYEYKITGLDVEGDKTRITATWARTGPNPTGTYSAARGRWRVLSDAMRVKVAYVPRNCNPCYDSDCDCIFDNVSDEYED